MITKHEVELLKRYSFLTEVYLKNQYCFFHYNVKGVPKVKKISFRATGTRIQELIKKIRKEKGVSIY